LLANRGCARCHNINTIHIATQSLCAGGKFLPCDRKGLPASFSETQVAAWRQKRARVAPTWTSARGSLRGRSPPATLSMRGQPSQTMGRWRLPENRRHRGGSAEQAISIPRCGTCVTTFSHSPPKFYSSKRLQVHDNGRRQGRSTIAKGLDERLPELVLRFRNAHEGEREKNERS